MKALAAPRSDNDQRPLSPEKASAVRLSDRVGRPVLVCCNCTTLGTPLFRGQGRLGPRRWQAIDGFRSVQRFFPSRALERSHRGLRATARRKAVPSCTPIPCGGSNLRTRETGALGQLFEERPLEGRGGSACGTLLSEAGDNALKAERPATSEELEEMFEGQPPSIPGGSRRTERHRRFRGHRI